VGKRENPREARAGHVGPQRHLRKKKFRGLSLGTRTSGRQARSLMARLGIRLLGFVGGPARPATVPGGRRIAAFGMRGAAIVGGA